MKTTSCTENKIYAFDKAPRCGAKSKRNNGAPCLCPAVKGKSRCRIHGGAKGVGAPRGNMNAFKHGNATLLAKVFRKSVRLTLKLSQEFLDEIDKQ